MMDVMAPASAPGRLRIDLAALADNWRDLARRAAPGRSAAVIKANAYGIGVSEAAPALWAAGARVFFVAHFSEGIAARRALPAEARSMCSTASRAAPTRRTMPSIGSRPRSAAKRSSSAGPPSPRDAAGRPCAIHLDTGMNRLGFESLARLQAAMATHGATSGADLLMSHFVSSEIPGDPLNQAQIERFEAARAAFPGLAASLANSSGMFLDPSPIYDLGRPGYALYGGNPTPGRANPMRPVVTLTAAIQQIRSIEAGMSCGYNAQWTAKRPTRLATLLIGYADGLPRGAGATDAKPGAEVAVAGRRAPLVGRVSMDLTIVDVTDLPEGAVRLGDPVEFFGPAIDLDDFATRSGTIGYHLLTSLGPRHQRTMCGASLRRHNQAASFSEIKANE